MNYLAYLFRIIFLIAAGASAWTALAAGTPIKLKPILPRIIEVKPAKAGAKVVPLTKEQERSNSFARAEKQALDDLAKGDASAGIRRYSALARSHAGTKVGGAIDLRVLEIYRRSQKPGDSPAAFQKAITTTLEKYKDENALGAPNKPLVQKITMAVQRMHRNLVVGHIRQAQAKGASPTVRKQALAAIDIYFEGPLSEAEKEQIRASKGEIQFLSDNHIAAAATFAALAGEIKGPKTNSYWRLAIRSQLKLAQWPSDPPWDGVGKGSGPARETLLSMYASISRPGDWSTISQMGLIHFHQNQQTDAFKLFMETLGSTPNGIHAQQAAGLMASVHIQNKTWQDLEDLARIMVKQNLRGLHKKQHYAGRDVLGMALLEGGLEKYTSTDYPTSATKLDEFVRGWREHPRHDQGFYTLALAHYAAKNYKVGVETMISFSKSYPKTKYRRDALVTGGAWSLALAWEDHVMYFLEAHVREFPRDAASTQSLETLTNLYMGREHYDAATRVMEIQLAHPQISPDTKSDIARRLLDMHEKNGSPASALRIADVLFKAFSKQPDIAAPALSLKGRLQGDESPAKYDSVIRQIAALDSTDRAVVEALSEQYFLKSEAMAKGVFERELYSLESRNPLADLNAAYGRYDQIRQSYEQACSLPGASWCGPSLHRLARVSDQFTTSIASLDIPRTLEPATVQEFLARKKSIIDTVDAKSLEADERSAQEAAAGSTNPDWTGAILWQNSADWQSQRVSGDTGTGYIQWHSGTAN